VLVGLLPAAGAVAVAVLRRRIGSRYGVSESAALIGIGLVTAGVLPLVVFTATGRVFRAAALGNGVEGLSGAQLASLDEAVCLAGPQARYLGGYPVADAFDPSSPVRFALAIVMLVGFPLLAALFVAMQARTALRRGPRWPAKFFWLPLLALTLLTRQTPAGSSGHLWIGVTIGAFLGIAVVLMAGAPSPEAVRRSAAPRRKQPRPLARRPGPAPGKTPGSRKVEIQARGPATPLAQRLAERFAARQPEPPIVVPEQRGASADRPRRPAGPPRPTLVAGAPPFAAPPFTGPPLPAAPVPGPPLAGAGGTHAAPRFRLVRRLGSGGFGRVWLAHDARLGHPVALKAAHAPDSEAEERIRREARALAAVRHPHCVRIHDLLPARSDPGLSELDGLVIVMEYVEGPPLGELVRTRGTLDDVTAAHVWIGVAGALEAAHARGVMHRDVKPGNVVLDRAGLAHLIDFGIARRTGDSTLTAAGFVLGTPDFLAPEVACGERATPASDAWQLAATISYALTGHPPRGEHPDAVSGLRAAASGARLTHLPRRSAHLPLLRAAMDTDPRRRPPLRTVQGALQDWLRRTGAQSDRPVAAGTRPR
jgi:eukaryotic-like serine/threonine-protein kinase